MKLKILLLVLVVLIVAAVFAVRATSEIANSAALRTGFAAQSEELRAKTVMLDARLRAAKNAVAEMERSEAMRAADRGGVDKSASSLASTKSVAARKLSPSSLVASDLNRIAEYLRNYRASLDVTLGGVFKRLGLTAEQIEKVKDMKAWHEQAQMDLRAAAEMHGLDMRGDAYKKMESELGAEIKKREVEVFGSAELLSRYQDLTRVYYLRETMQRLASSEMGTDVPATFAQVERATDIILASSQRRASGNSQKLAWQVSGWSFQDWAEVDWTVAEPQLRGMLSPEQFAALRQFFRTQESWTAVAKRNGANQTEAARLARQAGK